MGQIKFFKTPEKKTIFPVTRAEAVLYGNTTVDKALSNIDYELYNIKNGTNIPRISESEIDEIIKEQITTEEDTEAQGGVDESEKGNVE